MLLTLSALCVTGAPAHAADTSEDKAPDPTVLMSPVALPVVVDGEVVNYVYVTIRLGLSSRADPDKLRSKEAFFRDALVRAGHRTPFVRPDDHAALDEARLKKTLIQEANAIAGQGMVSTVTILKAQPQHQRGLSTRRTLAAR